jgi:hypothetical protein
MLRRAVTSLLGAGLLLGAVAPPVLAVDPIPGTPLPEEPSVTLLSGQVTEALAVDLDGDGVREVVAALASEDRPGLTAIRAWWVAADGSVQSNNEVRIRRSATFDDRIALGNGIRIDEEGMTGIRVSEPTHLFTVRRAGREVALAATIGTNPDLTNPCCLTIWDVTAAATGEIRLDLVVETNEFASQMAVADLDGDGTDELVTTETPPDAEADGDLVLGLLRWNGTSYDHSQHAFRGGLGCCAFILDVGDSDSVPGDEVLFSGGLTEVLLARLSLRAGSLVLEEVAVPTFMASVLHLPGGPAVLTAGDDTTVQLWSWLRDEPPQLLAERLHRSGVPLAVLGSGAQTVIVIGHGPDPDSVFVMDGDLAHGIILGADGRAGVAASVAQFDPRSLNAPYSGTIPGGVPGAPEAYVFSGLLVQPGLNSQDGGPASVEPIALLPDHSLQGTAGPDASWMATLAVPPTEGAIVTDHQVVNLLLTSLPAALGLIATESLLMSEVGFGVLEPTLTGVAPDPERPGDLIVGSEAVDVEIEGPPGSRIWWSRGGATRETSISADGIARIRLLEPAAPDADEGNAFSPSVTLVTPAGHAYHASWRIRIYRQPPDLGMDEEVPLIDFAPAVSGRTLPGSSISVNGQPGEVGPDGSFSVPIQAGVVPTEVRIVVIDVVGNRTERIVTRVWPLDYRQLPWVPIAVLLTLTAGAVLFLRQPESRPGRRLTPEDESTFEEIGG